MKKLLLAAAVAGCIISISSPVIAVEGHIKDMVNSPNPADRWRGEQYMRARDFDKKGESQKAYEVRDYADKRTERTKGAAEFAKDNWPGNK